MRKNLIPVFLAAIGVLAVSVSGSSGAAETRTSRTCFMPDRIANWSSGAKSTFNMRLTTGEVFQADIIGYCPEIDWSWQMAIVPRRAVSGMICVGDDATLLVPSLGQRADRCKVSRLRKLTDEQVAALPKKDAP